MQQTCGLHVQPMHWRTNPRITKKNSLWSTQPVRAAHVTLTISKLKNTKLTGHDQINLQHIKVTSQAVQWSGILVDACSSPGCCSKSCDLQAAFCELVLRLICELVLYNNTNSQIRRYRRTDKFQTNNLFQFYQKYKKM